MILFRPVGLEELLLIYRTGLRRFPPRLPEQPIFYPVLNADYAKRIARDWNTATGSMAGYVTEFAIGDAYVTAFPVHQVGSSQHRELWVPAKTLDEFNDHIEGRIRIVAAYFSSAFAGLIPKAFSLRGKNAREQFEALWEIHQYSLMDFHGEITANHEAVFAHYPYWVDGFATKEAPPKMNAQALLDAIRRVWESAFPEIQLGVQTAMGARG
jgi:hypothetical protein